MQTFKDRNGREWSIDITVGAVKRVRDVLKINLYELIDDNFRGLAKLTSDPISLVDVVFTLVSEQAAKAGILDTQFGESLAAESLQAAADAFVQAFIDFFPDRSQAAVLQVMVTKAKEAAAAISQQNATAIASLDVASLVDSLKKKSGSPPALSA